MHLDWERLSLSGYLEAREAHDDAHAPPSKPGAPAEPSEDLKRFFRAHLSE